MTRPLTQSTLWFSKGKKKKNNNYEHDALGYIQVELVLPSNQDRSSRASCHMTAFFFFF